MHVMDALYHRRAVRSYAPRPIDESIVRPLIDAAVQAPSAMNLQPWAFVVVLDRNILRAVSDRAKEHLVRTMAPSSPLAQYLDDLRSPAFNIFYDASALIVICATSSVPGASEDCALAAQNFMLAAHAHGFGTCWIGFARPWLNEPEGKAALGIPDSYAPVAPIIIGYPSGPAEAHPRRKPEIMVVHESPALNP